MVKLFHQQPDTVQGITLLEHELEDIVGKIIVL